MKRQEQELTRFLARLQRIKNFNIDNFLDSKIAEEQARQGGQPGAAGTPKRSSSNAGPRRGSARAGSPANRNGSRLRVPEGDGTPSKAPDPEEFVIGDDGSDISRTATPRPAKEGEEAGATEAEQGESKNEGDSASVDKGKEKSKDDELPEGVQQKLARLENLTSKYKGMLRKSALHHAFVRFAYGFRVP